MPVLTEERLETECNCVEDAIEGLATRRLPRKLLGLSMSAAASVVAILSLVLLFTVLANPAPAAAQTATSTACSDGTAVSNPGSNADLVQDCVTLLTAKDALRGSAPHLL